MKYEEYVKEMVTAANDGYAWDWTVYRIMALVEQAKTDFDDITFTEWQRMCKDAHNICSEYAKVHSADIEHSIRHHMVDSNWKIR